MSYSGCESMVTDVSDIRIHSNTRALELRFCVSVLESVEDERTVLLR